MTASRSADLRCSVPELRAAATRYADLVGDQGLEDAAPAIGARGYLTPAELLQLVRWKAPRSAGHVIKNHPEYLQEITRMALAARAERSRIEVLTLLNGVAWPTASVILHFYHSDPYPILDFRTLWTLGLAVPSQCRFSFWEGYVKICRQLAGHTGMPMRDLDRGLWQFSKENQT